jgi:uncharacterized protein YcfJ
MGSNLDMKKVLLLTALVAASSAVAEETTVKAVIEDRYSVVFMDEPYTKHECVMVDVPVYGTVTRQGDPAGGALLGMILGGLVGKGVTGKDNGAAAGAVMGGIIGADKGGKNKTERVITGYQKERRCDEITYWKTVETTTYDYSTITFKQNGKEYSATFVK